MAPAADDVIATTPWRAVDALPAAAGAPVMATGGVSIALLRSGATVPSDLLMWVALALSVAVTVVLCARAALERRRFLEETCAPASLTQPAAACVLGTRLALFGWRPAGIALLAIGALAWAALMPRVLTHWRTPTDGSSMLVAVATEGLAVLAAALGTPWLRWPAAGAAALGVALYGFALARFDRRQLERGRGDQWIAGGAAAIAALACASTAKLLGGPLPAIALALWVAAIVWLPALVLGELLRPRLALGARRWATVFPLGMYAAMSFAVGGVRHAPAITAAGRVMTWISLAAWIAVAVGAAVSAARAVSG